MKIKTDILGNTHELCKPVARIKAPSISDLTELSNHFRAMSKSDVASFLRKGGRVKNVKIKRTNVYLYDAGEYLTSFMAHNYFINYCLNTGRAEILEFIE